MFISPRSATADPETCRIFNSILLDPSSSRRGTVAYKHTNQAFSTSTTHSVQLRPGLAAAFCMSTLYRSPGYPCPASVSSDYRVSQDLLEFPRTKVFLVLECFKDKSKTRTRGFCWSPKPQRLSINSLKSVMGTFEIWNIIHHHPADRQKGGRCVAEPRGAVIPCSCYTGRFPDPSPLTPIGQGCLVALLLSRLKASICDLISSPYFSYRKFFFSADGGTRAFL